MQITNGARVIDVPRGAYEDTYKAKGYTPLPEESGAADRPKELEYTGGSPYAVLPMAALKQIAEARGMELPKGIKKAQLVEALTQSDAAEKEAHEAAIEDDELGGEADGAD